MKNINEINEKLIKVLEEKIQLLEEQKAINENIIEIQKNKLFLCDVGSSNKIDYKKGFELAIKYIKTTVVSMEQSKESDDYMVKLQDFIDKHEL
jgi:uncharacterized protein with ParB-like and HNH nuclease domain